MLTDRLSAAPSVVVGCRDGRGYGVEEPNVRVREKGGSTEEKRRGSVLVRVTTLNPWYGVKYG